MDDEILLILKMLSEHRISIQMAERAINELESLDKSDEINRKKVISQILSETEEKVDQSSDENPNGKSESVEQEEIMENEIPEENQLMVEGPNEKQDYNQNILSQETIKYDESENEVTKIYDKETEPDQVEVNLENLEALDSANEIMSEDFPEIKKEMVTPSYIDESESEILVDYDDNESSSANEFRRLSRKIISNNGTYPAVRSILVTSAMKNEGKSLIAANLAINMAKRETKNILLIDCDLRRPMINRLFGIKREPGLSSLLLGEAEINNVIRNTKLSNLKVLPSGRIIDSPSLLIPRIKDIIDICKNHFEVIICDSPPIMPVDDSVVLSQYIDGVLFVVMAGKTDRVVVKRAVDMLIDAKARLLGIAMNNMYKVMPYYYDYDYLKNKN